MLFYVTFPHQTRAKSKMADSDSDSEEGLSGSDSEESSDTADVSSSEYSASSDSKSEEENLATSSSGGKRAKGAATATAKTSRPRKKSKVNNMTLKSKEMEDLASWIFSQDEAMSVEQQIRSTLLEDPRVKSLTDRKHFAEHLLCAAEAPNFQLLVTGFCHRFSTLVQKAFASNRQNYRKAAFSVSWMKLFSSGLGRPRRSE